MADRLGAPGVVERFSEVTAALGSRLLRFNGRREVEEEGSSAELAESSDRIEPAMHAHVY